MSDALLCGAVIDSAFFLLSEKLRAESVAYACRKFGRVITEYTPWLSFAPIVSELDSALIYSAPEHRGGLLSDPPTLAALSELFLGTGSQVISDLPGERANWLPSTRHISTALPAALEALMKAGPFIPPLYREIVDFIVPLGGGRNRGFSTHIARGAIFRSLPADNDSADVAIDVAHELGHQVLIVWQSVDPILASDPLAPVFSQIRRTDRPAIQTFHATVALAYMREVEVQLANDPAIIAAAKRRGATYAESLSKSLELSISSVRKNCRLTDVGATMLNEMELLV